MALVLDHLRNLPEDMQSIGFRFNNCVTALVGCITTAAHDIERVGDDCALDLAERASLRVDDVILMSTLAAEIRPTISDTAMRDALVTIKTALSVLVSSWDALGGEERTRLLGIALHSLARFCYLSRSLMAVPGREDL